MNKLASVVYAYSPKNEDELELTAGDKIEVIGFAEEGWWKGRLKGRIGVFPSNFVQVIETGLPNSIQSSTISSSTTSTTNTATTILPQANKLNIFSNKTSKTSLSANSLNSNTSNNSNNNINNNYTNGNNNLTMNNTQHQQPDDSALTSNEDPSMISSETRPKPIRGVGYGDIFASSGAKPKLMATTELASTAVTSDRPSINMSMVGTLPKQIPKKPPPPAPISDNGIGPSNEQAPALPPKPSNQFSPHQLQHARSISPAQQHQSSIVSPQQVVREQARVIYAYQPTNHDELAMEVGDIIDIIDKQFEDAGWWKGELRGKIGVFPDNFVQLIEVVETPPNQSSSNYRGTNPNRSILTSAPDNRFKPSLTPSSKSSIGKPLENNWESRSTNVDESNDKQAALISMRRDKLQQSSGIIASKSMMNDSVKSREDLTNIEPSETTSNKLKHITANRAKGPPRRPPSSIQNKRNQTEPIQKEQNGIEDDKSMGSLPINASLQLNSTKTESSSTIINHDSLPPAQHTTPAASLFSSSKPNNGISLNNPLKHPSTTVSLDEAVESSVIAPKTSQRLTQALSLDKNKTATSTPPWMVELKKAHAERKRDSPVVVAANAATTAALAITLPEEQPATRRDIEKKQKVEKQSTLEKQKQKQQPQSPQQQKLEEPQMTVGEPLLNSAQYDELVRQISISVTSEFKSLRDEMMQLKEEVRGINELKSVLEVMKVELKACQSATENQKRYIKELVNNLADERKRIAAMQTEIDRTLK